MEEWGSGGLEGWGWEGGGMVGWGWGDGGGGRVGNTTCPQTENLGLTADRG